MLKAFLAAFIFAAVAASQPDLARAKALLNTPVYNPDTGSYFELADVGLGWSIRGPSSPEIGWARAQQFAYSRTYKGVRGRLALVKSAATNDFLRRTFKPDQAAWIGLRYWCQHRKLQLATGEFYPKTGYTNWDQIWATTRGSRGPGPSPVCGAQYEYWPVHYWSIQEGFRWSANGTYKEFYYLFIEYPTGKE